MFIRHKIASCLCVVHWGVMPIMHTILKPGWGQGFSPAVGHRHIHLFPSNFSEHLLVLLHVHLRHNFQANKEVANKLHNQSKIFSVSPPHPQITKTFKCFLRNKQANKKYREGIFLFFKDVLDIPFVRAKRVDISVSMDTSAISLG